MQPLLPKGRVTVNCTRPKGGLGHPADSVHRAWSARRFCSEVLLAKGSGDLSSLQIVSTGVPRDFGTPVPADPIFASNCR